ncbi:MAG TPA: hypothetical protein VF677_07000, partial [Flavobacterium sp.]
LSLYDKDMVDDQLILKENFTLSADTYIVIVDLSTIGRSKGHDYYEGWEQELYTKVEVLDQKLRYKAR